MTGMTLKPLPLPAALVPLALATLVPLAACNEERTQTAAREIGEEVNAVVEEIGPEDMETPLPPAPAALISPDETLAAIEGAGGLPQLGAAAAGPVIDKWIGTLAGNLHVDDTDLLVEDLRRLRAELGKPSIDGDVVEDVLERLARETRQAGEDADDDRVLALAKWLERGAEALD